ncbi:DNA sulfur modification protein DndB, partial [Enterovibrio norvegicus]|uniref:DNA sulfur modification protein DndB n=1 Tax=Enterovibrio norvegicus TaxID=188144 RepID=UPI00037CC889
MSDFTYKFPSARGMQAGRPFFNMCMPMRTLVQMLRLDNGAIEKRSQRLVNDQRASKVAKYILNNRDTYVIPCLTGVIELPPESEFTFEVAQSELVGTLSVPMDSSLMLFDGQHRAMGIAKALEEDPSLSSEMVPVMMFVNLSLAERRLAFTDINQNVSKPAQSISDTFNSRDALPAFAVELANELNCFKGLVDFERNSISAKSPYMFPLKALKEATATIMGCGPNPATLSDEQKQFARDAWAQLAESMGWGVESLGDMDAPAFREKSIKTHVVMLKAMAVAVKHIAAN